MSDYLDYFSLANASRTHARTMTYKNRTIFCNENQEAILPPKVSWKEVARYYLHYPQDARPKNHVPFVDSDFKMCYFKPSIAWLGHSSLFLTFLHLHILVDPIFSMYASPFPFANRAFKQTKCFCADDFPPLFAVIITHSHFDHLDKASIMQIQEKTRYFICPLKVGDYLKSWKIPASKIIELDWWNGIALRESCAAQKDFVPQDLRKDKQESTKHQAILRIIATPSQHNSARMGGFNTTLWASFVIEFLGEDSQYTRVFLSGDGGYYTHFQRIKEAFGGFDLACLESGQYNQAWRFSHSFPHEIVQEAIDLKAKMVLPIHWGRFIAGTHAWNGVAKYLHQRLPPLGILCAIPQIGQVYTIGENPPTLKWWENE
ncbi:Zn-dependent hydrolase [Helicobacter sp. MIT 05-5293]|uniref:MBL fold metallo-hydrolase n=1 Tax=Helicobacter sp. MIT 05-5293 TaxID=1548149 RepID=UPI00068AF46A|nr:MBL fold metallo-hydrolase [Helicobacter sp. MIT 05-5293]TLD80839.1 Zn-dependent hydrolase [Helicobacter sp. MIT 05-5293]